MTFKSKLLATGAALVMASFATAANASSVLIEGTGLWGDTATKTNYSLVGKSFQFSFTLPTNPIASNPTFDVSNFTYSLDGKTVANAVNSIEFFSFGQGGMFDLNFGGTTVSLFGLDIGSTKFFTTPKSYLVDAGLNGNGGMGNAFLTVTATGAVPEPATWALMITGFGLVGMAIRRRRTKVTVAYA